MLHVCRIYIAYGQVFFLKKNHNYLLRIFLNNKIAGTREPKTLSGLRHGFFFALVVLYAKIWTHMERGPNLIRQDGLSHQRPNILH